MPLFNNVLAGAAGSGGAADYKIERSLRFNSGDQSSLERQISNTTTFSFSFWYKHVNLTRNDILVTDSSYGFFFYQHTDGSFRVNNNNANLFTSNGLYRDPSAWYHCLLTNDGSTLKLYVNGVLDKAQTVGTLLNGGGIYIGRDRASANNYGDFYMADAHLIDGSALAPTDFGEFSNATGVWNPKKYSGSHGTNGFHLDFANASDLGSDAAGSNNFTATGFTGAVQSLASPNLPGWGNPDSYWNLSNQVNSNYLTATYSGSGTYKGVTSNILASNTTYHFFLEQYAGSNDSYSGWFFVDASSAPSNTVPDELGGDTLGQRVGETHAGHHGSYATANGGTNGQDKIDLTSIKANTSGGQATFSEWVINTSVNKVWVRAVGASGWIGGGNPATTSSTPSFNLSSATNKRFGYMGWGSGTYAKFLSAVGSASDIDSLFDSPTNYDDGTNIGGNFCTWNVLDKNSNIILSNGNLEVSETTGQQMGVRATHWLTSGRWYWEVELKTSASTVHNGGQISIGVVNENQPLDGQGGAGAPTGSVVMWPSGAVYKNGLSAGTNSAYNQPGTVVGLALDMDARTLSWYINGTLQSVSITGLENRLTPFVHVYGPDNDVTLVANFGQRPFKYTNAGTDRPAATYLSICTQNFDDPLITDGSDYFDTKLWTGNGQQKAIGGPIYSTTSTMNNATNAFNGDESNGAVFGSASVLTSSSITITSSLQLKHNRNGGNGITVNINGTDYTATGNSNSAYHTIPIPAGSLPLTSTGNITVTDNDGNSTLYAVKVDGSVLIDGTGDPYSFSPDLVWTKQRNSAGFHALFDTTRGVHNAVRANTSGGTYTDNGLLTAFNSDGFSIGSAGDINGNNNTYVGWAWDGGDLAANSDYYQTHTWSSSSSFASSTGFRSSEPETNAFDGNTNTICSAVGSGVVTFTSPVTFPSSSTIKVFVHGGDHTVSVNGGTDQTVSAGSLQTITFSNSSASTFTITFQRVGSSDTGIRAIEIGGKLLIDAGVVPVGSLTSSVYNQSQTWRNNVTGGSNAYGAVANAFNGDLTNFASPEYSSPMTYTNPSPSDTVISTFRIYGRRNQSANTCNLNNTDITSQISNTNQWHTITGFAGQNFSSLYWRPTSGNLEVRIAAIEINGKILVDDDVTPPSVPQAASTQRANPTAGFSIVKVDNPNSTESRAHGLNKKPDLIIGKALTGSQQWHIYHSALGKDYYGTFQTNAFSSSDQWGSQEPDSNLFYVKSNTGSGANFAGGMIYFIWTAVDQYSAFGSYVGTGSASTAPFQFCGFTPKWILFKMSSGTGDWRLMDTSRDPRNPCITQLYPNNSDAEIASSSAHDVDYLSNGFKVATNHSAMNANGQTYVWAAFSSSPFKHARAR